MSVDEALPLHWVAGIVARYTWDDHSWQVLSERHVRFARVSGRSASYPSPSMPVHSCCCLLVSSLPQPR